MGGRGSVTRGPASVTPAHARECEGALSQEALQALHGPPKPRLAPSPQTLWSAVWTPA